MKMKWSIFASSFIIAWIFWISGCNKFPCLLTSISRGKFQRYFNHHTAMVCIIQPSLGTRRCIGFWISSCPRSGFRVGALSIRAFWCSRMVHVWRTWRESWCQVHRRRLRFCYNPVFFLFLHPLRHRFGAAQSWNSERSRESWSGFCCTNKEDCSIRHVKNFPCLACLRVGFWCRCIWFGFWGPDWFDRTTNQVQPYEFGKHVSL